jgi:hypothetical protein
MTHSVSCTAHSCPRSAPCAQANTLSCQTPSSNVNTSCKLHEPATRWAGARTWRLPALRRGLLHAAAQHLLGCPGPWCTLRRDGAPADAAQTSRRLHAPRGPCRWATHGADADMPRRRQRPSDDDDFILAWLPHATGTQWPLHNPWTLTHAAVHTSTQIAVQMRFSFCVCLMPPRLWGTTWVFPACWGVHSTQKGTPGSQAARIGGTG